VRDFGGKQKDLFSLDVNSRFETAPGIKDIGLVRQFVATIKQ
jgi:phosphoribosylanthranilate isomerase